MREYDANDIINKLKMQQYCIIKRQHRTLHDKTFTIVLEF